jgi:N-acetylated-alpha-linked acidic dipeptidase
MDMSRTSDFVLQSHVYELLHSYPHGPARNPTSVQRGSVQFLSLYPGDPSTPGYPSYENSTRVEGGSKPTIPSLPISWANAEVLLKHLEDGHEGVTVRLVNNGEIAFSFPSPDPSPFVVDEKVTPIWNVMGVIPGHVKSEVVVIGAHRDGEYLRSFVIATQILIFSSLGNGSQ